MPTITFFTESICLCACQVDANSSLQCRQAKRKVGLKGVLTLNWPTVVCEYRPITIDL